MTWRVYVHWPTSLPSNLSIIASLCMTPFMGISYSP